MILLAGGAALVVAGKKKKKKKSGAAASPGGDESATMPDDDPSQSALASMEGDSNQVVFSADFSNYEVGAVWRYKTLDAWLNERRLAGKLLTKESEQPGLLYELLIDNPSTFLGELFGQGKETGKWIYASLWAMATLGVTAQAFGFAGGAARSVANLGITTRALPAAVGASEAAAVTQAATKLPRFKLFMASMRNTRAGLAAAKRQGIKSSAKMMTYSGQLGAARAVNGMRIGNTAQIISSKAAMAGSVVAAEALFADGMPEDYSADLAASAMEAVAEFTAEHEVKVGLAGIPFKIAAMPGTDENPAVQDFNKFITNYVMRFQKSTYEE